MGSSLVLNRRPKVPAEDTAAFGAIAERFRRAGALEQAVSLCRDGLKKFPDHVSARVTLGWSLLDLGKYDEARLELEQVMRRAPDNLAAIRGLAELHDRFEHTLNLPMDGPGQWPPPADSVDAEATPEYAPTPEASDATNFVQFEAEAPAQPEPVFAEESMAPAAMGLPLWAPEPAASPVAEAVSAPTASAPATTAGSGMSSVREIDAFAGAPVPGAAAQTQAAPQTREEIEDVQLELEAPVVAIAAHVDVTDEVDLTQDFAPTVISSTADELGVTDDALAALIAEADSLEAAAALDVVEAPAPLELGSVEVDELDTAPIVLEALEANDVSELDVVPVEAAAVEIAEVAQFAAVAVPEIDVIAEVAAEVEEIGPEVTEVAAEVTEVAAEVAEVLAFTTRPTAVAESVELEPMELLVDEQEEPVVQAIAVPSKSAAKVVALEQILRRVHSRRHQLMAESVA